jgi:tetrahydromethanopterin S-methyltransferase subunit B
MSGFETWKCFSCGVEGSGPFPVAHVDTCPRTYNAKPDDAPLLALQAARRIAELEQHVSDLEKSLENAQKERDSTERSSAEVYGAVNAMCAARPEEDTISAMQRVVAERDAVLADNAEMLRHLWFLVDHIPHAHWNPTPTRALLEEPHPGAALRERMKRLEEDLREGDDERRRIANAGSALVKGFHGRGDKITELEQYVSDLEKSLENARKERDEAVAANIVRFSVLGERLRAVETARDAALADNAALLDALRDAIVSLGWAGSHFSDGTAERVHWESDFSRALRNRDEPHPGAALLERLKRLEEALKPLSGAVRDMHAYAMNKPFRLQIAAELDGRAYVAEATAHEVLAIIAAIDH